MPADVRASEHQLQGPRTRIYVLLLRTSFAVAASMPESLLANRVRIRTSPSVLEFQIICLATKQVRATMKNSPDATTIAEAS